VLLLSAAPAVGACPFDITKLDDVVFAIDAEDVWLDGSFRPTPAASGEARLVVTNNLDDTVSVVFGCESGACLLRAPRARPHLLCA
jgi:hypothetical protein